MDNQTQPAAQNEPSSLKHNGPTPSILELLRERKELSDALRVAVSLLQIEARDHSEGYAAGREQRRRIANTLQQFIGRACDLLNRLGDREIAATPAAGA